MTKQRFVTVVLILVKSFGLGYRKEERPRFDEESVKHLLLGLLVFLVKPLVSRAEMTAS